MTEPAQLAKLAQDFAVGNALTVVPAVPDHDVGPEVVIAATVVDLPGFLALAAKLGGGVLYLETSPFEPDTEGLDTGDTPLPTHLLKHRGQACRITVAFAVNGLIHFWEHEAAWYQQWQADTFVSRLGTQNHGADEPERLSDEERARLATELAATLLADPGFRAAKLGGARQRYAKFAIPADTDRWVGWDATREALDRAEELAQTQYAQLTERLDDLAAELLSDASYQRAGSPVGRKQVAEQFLIPRADGFAPPAHIRDELYARAQRLAKSTGRPATLL